MTSTLATFQDTKSNPRFFLALAVEKTTAKLAAQGMTVEQVGEFLTRPGHMVDLLKFAEDLHIQAIDRLIVA